MVQDEFLAPRLPKRPPPKQSDNVTDSAVNNKSSSTASSTVYDAAAIAQRDRTLNELLKMIVLSGPPRQSPKIPQVEIATEHDISARFEPSIARLRIVAFFQLLSEASRGRRCLSFADFEQRRGVVQLIRWLDAMQAQIALHPPLPGPRRFGNRAFRSWIDAVKADAQAQCRELFKALSKNDSTIDRSVDGRSEDHLKDSATADDNAFSNNPLTHEWTEKALFVELLPYLLESFGSRQRLDYGTGHELAFAAFLCGLFSLRLLSREDVAPISLAIVSRYLRLVRELIVVYNLEPAGSHGVWGLDDYSFLPYILGSAQFSGIADAPPPRDSLVRHQREALRDDNLYLGAVYFVCSVKTSPFHEHSPMLFDISSVPRWEKVHMVGPSCSLDQLAKYCGIFLKKYLSIRQNRTTFMYLSF